MATQTLPPTRAHREQAARAIPDAAPWVARFPSPELVAAAAALFPRERNPERSVTVSPDAGWVRGGAAAAKSRELFGGDGFRCFSDREVVEGPQWRVEVGPGYVAVRSSDPARRYRAEERAQEDARRSADLLASRLAEDPDYREPEGPGRGIRSWSRKSRSRMVATLGQLDFRPMFAEGRAPVMVTLTYPGDWLTVAPDAATCHKHLLALRKRWERRWGGKLLAVWKREFQRRGAPHYHLLVVPPDDPGFRDWLSAAWASIVAHPDPEQRQLHELAGTGVDAVEGGKMSDPRRIGVYFSKHGSFAAKDYQNEAPREWLHTAECLDHEREWVNAPGAPGEWVCGGECRDASVGRFWGYWHLDRAVAATEVAEDVARHAARAARRWSRANSYSARVRVWRNRVDTDTGELLGGRYRWSTVRVRRFSRASGYLVVNDGAAFASQLAAAAQTAVAPDRSRGPLVRGFLP